MNLTQEELNKQLLEAAEKNDFEGVKESLLMGANVNAATKKGSTALILTTTSQIINMLIKSGADLNATDVFGRSVYSDDKSIKVLDLIVKAGGNVDTRKVEGPTALMNSHSQKHINYLLAQGADINAKDRSGNSVLLRSVKRYSLYSLRDNNFSEKEKIAKLFIMAGADVNAINDVGDTPLMLSQSFEITKNLIQYSAEVNAKDSSGTSVLMRKLKAYDFNDAHKEMCGEYLEPMEKKRNKIVKILIESGADVNYKRPSDGNTPLMLVENINDAKSLLRAGAKINAKNFKGETALFQLTSKWAERVDYTEIRDKIPQLLIKAGADVNAITNNFETALMVSEWSDITRELIKYKADVNAKDSNGTSVLMHKLKAYYQEDTDYPEVPPYSMHPSGKDRNNTVLMLLQAKADVNYQRPSDGKTPLMLCEEMNDAKNLIAYGADILLKDSDGKLAHEQEIFNNSSDLKKIKSYLVELSLMHVANSTMNSEKLTTEQEHKPSIHKHQRL